MRLSWILGEPDTRRPIKDIRDLLEDAKPVEVETGGMARDVETMITVNRVLASRNRYKKPFDSNRK